MIGLFQSGGFWRPACVRNLVCLLLILTFLHNPFLGAATSSQYPSVSHPPSFRATVASSELLKFKPREQGEIQDVQNGEVILLSAATIPQAENFERCEIADAPISAHYLFVGNLWFRPPPKA